MTQWENESCGPASWKCGGGGGRQRGCPRAAHPARGLLHPPSQVAPRPSPQIPPKVNGAGPGSSGRRAKRVEEGEEAAKEVTGLKDATGEGVNWSSEGGVGALPEAQTPDSSNPARGPRFSGVVAPYLQGPDLLLGEVVGHGALGAQPAQAADGDVDELLELPALLQRPAGRGPGRNPSLLSGVLGTGLPGLGTEHLPGALCSGTGSRALGTAYEIATFHTGLIKA